MLPNAARQQGVIRIVDDEPRLQAGDFGPLGREDIRREAQLARGKHAWTPKDRQREVSPALRAYAAMTTNAARGAVRDVSQVERSR